MTFTDSSLMADSADDSDDWQCSRIQESKVHADAEYDNQGCGQKLQDGSAGPKFNSQGGALVFSFAPKLREIQAVPAGGIFVAEWDPVAA